jgi:hypothetical protein
MAGHCHYLKLLEPIRFNHKAELYPIVRGKEGDGEVKRRGKVFYVGGGGVWPSRWIDCTLALRQNAAGT